MFPIEDVEVYLISMIDFLNPWRALLTGVAGFFMADFILTHTKMFLLKLTDASAYREAVEQREAERKAKKKTAVARKYWGG